MQKATILMVVPSPPLLLLVIQFTYLFIGRINSPKANY
jgi:hypothetical protein